jgi:hypothetical protein
MLGLLDHTSVRAYETLRNYKLDEEQVEVIRHINRENKSLFYIKASAGVGKTSVIDSLLFALANHYHNEQTSNVVLVLVPNRELRHDICQDLVTCKVLSSDNLLWLGRPPPGRPDGLWDDILDARLKEMQKDTWTKLDLLKSQLKVKLDKLDATQQPGPQKWSYITEIYLVDAAPSAIITEFLEVITAAKMILREDIRLEIESLVKTRDDLHQQIGRDVHVAASTADAYAKFLAKQSKNNAARILREKSINVAILDEAQSYELDQVMACVGAPGPGNQTVKTVVFAGDPHQVITWSWPRWTSAPWVSEEASRVKASPLVEEVDTDTPVLIGPRAVGMDTLRNPEHRPFTTWLGPGIRCLDP